jgi:hypothetical protein
LVQSAEQSIEGLLAGGLSLDRRVVPLAFERGPEPEGADEERGGLSDRLVVAATG